MSNIPTTAIVDVQNVYGLSGDVLGVRRKPTPDGVAAALLPYGFEVDEVEVPIGVPAANDAERVRQSLTEAATRCKQVTGELTVIGGSQGHSITRVCEHLDTAAAILECVVPEQSLNDQLFHINAAAERALDELRQGASLLDSAASRTAEDAQGRPQVPGDWVVAVLALVRLGAQMDAVVRTVESVSSYAWAGRNNLAHESDLLSWSGAPTVRVHPGRFRPGYEGREPDEKRIDTLCAVACVEQTRRAVTAGASRAVVVLSDDDDLTPAAYAAARAAIDTAVVVVVAGTDVVARRLLAQPPVPERPRWLVLDQHAWHRIVGLDPVAEACARHQLARLALGARLPFRDVGKPGLATTPQGLAARIRPRDLRLPAALYLSELQWRSGRRSDAQVPQPVVTAAGPLTDPPGRPVTCQAAQHTRLALDRIPVEMDGSVRHIDVPAPGWWMAGDEVVVASSGRGRDAWRAVGPSTPRTAGDLAVAVRGRVVRFSNRTGGAIWATVATPGATFSVLVHQNASVGIGDEVAVVPYERRSTGWAPRALLASSALGPTKRKDAPGGRPH